MVELALEHREGQRWQRSGDGDPVALGGEVSAVEVELSHLHAKYTALVRPAKGPGRPVFVDLQKRLLSSVEAFTRTLQLHARSAGKGGAAHESEIDADEDLDDDAREELDGVADEGRSRTLGVVRGEARRLLDEPAPARRGGHRAGPRTGDAVPWGMSDEAREEVRRAFNSAPGEHPLRILVATDAAREGVNLQGHRADLFHLDVPWNPARMVQRNGRIDRTLQLALELRCHYFVLPQRAEDQVLRTLVKKVERIEQELGSLATGIDANAGMRVEAAALSARPLRYVSRVTSRLVGLAVRSGRPRAT